MTAKVRKEIGDGILAERNISLGEYLDSNNQKRPMYQLDKEASIYMVSGEIGRLFAVGYDPYKKPSCGNMRAIFGALSKFMSRENAS